MPAYKDETTGTWYTKFYYKTYTGKSKPKLKRGFKRKGDALAWEDDFKASKQGSPDMSFEMFWGEYKDDLRYELKETTWEGKINIVDTKILPFFAEIPLNEIGTRTIRKWQNEIQGMKKKNGEPYAQTYLKSINNELSAIINHAVTYYNLPNNPIHKTGSIGEKHAEEQEFWTHDEFNQFIEYFNDDLLYYTVYNFLYYTGVRQGEMLALTLEDFDLDNYMVSINKNWGRRLKKNGVTTTKTRSSNREIVFPHFLKDVLLEYVESLYGYKYYERLFSYTNKSQLNRKLKKAAAETGVKPIRVHDLRHSHAAYLIDKDVNMKALQHRLGHKRFETTYNTYGHIYPNKQEEVMHLLNGNRDE